MPEFEGTSSGVGSPPAACPLCAGTVHSVYRRVGPASLLACSGCGLVFIPPGGAPGDSRQYLEDSTSPSAYYQSTAALDRATFGDRLRRFEVHVPAGRILDVGCSVGTFLQEARARGWQGAGIEPNPMACARAREAELEVIEGFFSPTCNELLKGEFDAVHLGDVIEHVFDPVGFLRLAGQALRPGGVIAVCTPNFDSRLARWFQVKPHEHVIYFTARTLSRALIEAGFSVLDVAVVTRRRDLAHLDRGTTPGPATRLIVRALRATRTSGLASRWLYRCAGDELLAFASRP